MEPTNEKTLEIALRTKKNLDYIYQQKALGADVEEFTQLLNSMLGLVISVREDYYCRGGHVSWQELHQMGLLQNGSHLEALVGQSATRTSPGLQQVNSFSQLVTKLRNAFAHNCYSLVIDRPSRQITGVTVWNIPLGKDNKPVNRTWEQQISESDLRALAYLIVEYINVKIGF